MSRKSPRTIDGVIQNGHRPCMQVETNASKASCGRLAIFFRCRTCGCLNEDLSQVEAYTTKASFECQTAYFLAAVPVAV